MNDLKYGFEKNVKYLLTDGSHYISRKLRFTEKKDENGRPVIIGKTEQNDVILTLTGRSDNAKSAKLQIHKKVSELDRDIYFDQIWDNVTDLNSSIKERPLPDKYDEWYEQAFQDIEERRSSSETILGDDIVTMSYDEPYYEFQIFGDMNK